MHKARGHHRVGKKIQVRTCQKQTAGFVRDVTRLWNVGDVKGIIVQDV